MGAGVGTGVGAAVRTGVGVAVSVEDGTVAVGVGVTALDVGVASVGAVHAVSSETSKRRRATWISTHEGKGWYRPPHGDHSGYPKM